MAAKKKRRLNVPRPYCRGTMTAAKKRSMIISGLRRVRWNAKYMALEDAFVKKDINPATGRKAKLYRCARCGMLFSAANVAVDHISPVIPIEGFDTWEGVVERMFCEPEGLQVLCKTPCHAEKTASERMQRKFLKKDD